MTFSQMLTYTFPVSLLIVFIVSVIMSAAGFYKFVYFLSVGYGFAITGEGVAIFLLNLSSITPAKAVLCLLLVIYGIRLGFFLLWREIKSASYRKTLKEASSEKPMPVFVKVAIWISVALLYTMQVSPVFYRASSVAGDNFMAWIGVFVMAVALIIESVADKQKSAAKEKNPHSFCSTGLYKIVRCPNYFGEILFWTGVLLSGFGALSCTLQWLVAIMGYILIFYVMLSGAKRLELRQNKNYGNDPEYRAYVAKTPILLPFIPIYHLENIDFIKA